MASVMSLVMMIFMAIPVIAPNLGQLVLFVGDWHEIFIAVAAFGAFVTLWTYFRLPETQHPEDRLPLTVGRVAQAFRVVITNRTAFAYTLSTALTFGVLFAFINQAEQIYVSVYGLGPAFTLYFSAGAIFMAVASFSNSRLVQRFGMRHLSHGALCIFLALNVLHLVIALLNDGVPPFAVYLPMTILSLCMFGFIGTNFNALAMDPLGHVAGTASSVLGFMQTFGGGVLGGIVGYMYDGTLIPLLVGYVLLSIGAFVCVLVAENGKLFHERRSPRDGGRASSSRRRPNRPPRPSRSGGDFGSDHVADRLPGGGVRRSEQTAVDVGRHVGRAVELGDIAAGLLDQERAGEMVPGHELQIELEVHVTRGHEAVLVGGGAIVREDADVGHPLQELPALLARQEAR